MNEVEFEESEYYTGPDVTDALVEAAEMRLGVRLPPSYVSVLRVRNGGVPRRRLCRTDFGTTWAPDHFEIRAILGIGGERGIDAPGPYTPAELIEEWGYPAIGVVFCDTPSGGHDTVMFDYRNDPLEPAVAYVDEDRIPRVVAQTFAEFVDRLELVTPPNTA